MSKRVWAAIALLCAVLFLLMIILFVRSAYSAQIIFVAKDLVAQRLEEMQREQPGKRFVVLTKDGAYIVADETLLRQLSGMGWRRQ